MSQRVLTYITPQEYLQREREAEYKSEYLNGEIFAMSGASRAHNLITTNITGELRQQLRGRPCETYAGDMRVKVSAAGFYTYPNVVVVCGDPQFEDAELDTLLNPSVLIGVVGIDRTLRSNGQDILLSNYRISCRIPFSSSTQGLC